MTVNQVSNPATSPSAKTLEIAQKAQDFEAMLIASWLKEMRQSWKLSEDSQDGAAENYQDMATQAVATAISNHGGLGIARLLVKQLSTK